jgi:hypothetical protein
MRCHVRFHKLGCVAIGRRRRRQCPRQRQRTVVGRPALGHFRCVGCRAAVSYSSGFGKISTVGSSASRTSLGVAGPDRTLRPRPGDVRAGWARAGQRAGLGCRNLRAGASAGVHSVPLCPIISGHTIPEQGVRSRLFFQHRVGTRAFVSLGDLCRRSRFRRKNHSLQMCQDNW